MWFTRRIDSVAWGSNLAGTQTHSMQIMKPVIHSFTFLILGALMLQAQDFSKVEIKATHVAGRVYMLEGAGGNIGVSAGPDGILIVDDQFAPLADKIEAALAKLDKGPVRYVLNTHWHGDHTGGNAHFGKSATIVAHKNVRERLAGKSETPPSALPVITFDQSISVHFNGEEIRIYPLPPGHTDGDSVVHFTKSGVLHMGDLFFNKRFPFIDLASGGSAAGYAKDVQLVLDSVPEGTRIIPGHGELADVKDLETFRNMLRETIGLVNEAIGRGETLAQVKVAGVPAAWKDYGAGFINTSRYLEIVFNSLTEEK